MRYCILVQLLLRLLSKGEELKTRIHGKIAIKATRSASLKDTGYKGERAPQEHAGYKDFHDGGRLEMAKAGSGASRWGQLLLATERAEESNPGFRGFREGVRDGGFSHGIWWRC